MIVPPLKILYVRAHFPKNSETFIMEEVAYLKGQGHDVRVLAMGCELEGLHKKTFEARLFDNVTYRLRPLRARQGARLLVAFVRRALRDAHYRRRYLRDLLAERPGDDVSSARSVRRSFARLVRAEPASVRHRLRKTFEALRSSLVLDNLSLGVHQAVHDDDFQPDVIHCPFMFPWETSCLVGLVDAYPDVPLTVTVRARDLYARSSGPDAEARERILARAAAIVTISRFNADHLRSRTPEREIPIVHSSIDTSFFSRRSGVAQPPRAIVTVARLVPKKGLAVLVEALAHLASRGVDFSCKIVGQGPLKASLEERIVALGLRERVGIVGPLTQHQVREVLAAASVFALPCVVAEDGDRDMLPNVLKEAMAMELPVVTSAISGIEELIDDGRDGILVPAGAALPLADAIAAILADPDRAAALGRAAREKITTSFDIASEGAKLVQVFAHVLGG